MAMNCAKYGLISAAVAVLSVTTSGCVADYGSLSIVHDQAPNESCEIAPNVGDAYLPHGTALVGAGGGYVMAPLLRSGLAAVAGKPNGHIINLSSAQVSIEPVDSDDSRAAVAALKELRARSRAISGSVEPGGLTSIFFDGIDGEQARALASAVVVGQAVEVLIKVVVKGDVGGSSVSTQDFLFPVTLLNSGGTPGAKNLGPCSSFPTSFTGATTDCFGTGQDGGSIECCTDAGGNAVCPAVGTMAGP
jgi:hypothetical protein